MRRQSSRRIKQQVLAEAYKRVAVVKKQYEDGIITEGERHSKIISIWTEVSDKLSEDLFKLIYDTSTGNLNPLYLMVDSGARGNKSQVKQLGRSARLDGETIRRDHRIADYGELPRRVDCDGVLHLDSRSP